MPLAASWISNRADIRIKQADKQHKTGTPGIEKVLTAVVRDKTNIVLFHTTTEKTITLYSKVTHRNINPAVNPVERGQMRYMTADLRSPVTGC